MKNTLLVTGGAGFIGSNLIRSYLAQPEVTIVNLDALTYAGDAIPMSLSQHPRYHFVQGNILDSRLVTALLHQYEPRAILHCAAESHVDRSIDAPTLFLQTNVMGTQRLLECVLQYWHTRSSADQQAFRFLHVSTDEVFGDAFPDRFFTEASPYAPRSPYAASKAASDHFVQVYGTTYHLPTLISHCSNNYGPFQFPEKLIPLTILRALSGESLPLYGDGLQQRDWLHVEDHCRALQLMLAHGAAGSQFVVGGGQPYTNRAVVLQICAILDALLPRADGRSYNTQIALAADRPGHDRRYAIDATRIRTTLGWTPQIDFATGIRQTVQWYLEHPEWCGAIDMTAYRQRLGLRGATE